MSTGDEPQISILDARLAEIDRRLHTIQTGLGEEEAPSRPGPSAAQPPPVQVPGDAGPVEPTPPSEMLGRLRELTQAQEGVLASMRELLRTLERVATPAAAEPIPLSVSAGPFDSTEALRGFERALESLPGVLGVEVRGFEGGDRAIMDVHLA